MKMTITTKLFVAYGVMVLLAVIMGSASILGLLSAGRSTDEIGEVTAKKMFAAGMVSRARTLSIRQHLSLVYAVLILLLVVLALWQ